jgi:outer membrane protein OmpA-like peptidoglycan-associated protein
MIHKANKIFLSAVMLLVSAAVTVPGVLAQSDNQVRNVAAGVKTKLKGIIVSKDAEKLVVRDATGVDTNVLLTPTTSVKTKGGFFGGGDTIPQTALVRGLNLEVEGMGDASGSLVATKVRFGKDDYRTAQSIESRVGPAEERISQTEQNAQRLSGQIDELMAISNAARGGAKAAQESADAAIAGVNATNQRITALDDYVVQSTSTVNFKVGSSFLSPEAKESLDQVAQTAITMKGYVIEVTGFADATGSVKNNKALSQRRAQAVLDYLVETHNIPLRRISTSYGFGELQAVADNTTREGRAQNRRVEVKILVSRGMNQNVEVRTAPTTDNPTNNK